MVDCGGPATLFPERTLDSGQGVSYSLLGTTHLEELLLGNLVENA